ncbi:citrate synthase [Pseudonocardia sp. TRM90224]|uniref:citrate synthase n=1 Tax=Pseudonocardia sp. TRM90224 TaxID=2812678 RepID=UPI001E55BB5D|nr:citrate synthase [Pseudonocardia sp. TRM90224]
MERMTTREVAAHLGVKPETVYAYVSRGLLTSVPAESGRGSTFDPAEVAALAEHGRRPAEPGGVPAVATAITLIENDRCYLRGVEIGELSGHPYEAVAEWLWTQRWQPDARWRAPRAATATARAAVAALPPSSGVVDRLRVAAVAAGASDPLRFDLATENVCAAGRSLIATLVDALPPAGERPARSAPLVRRLWPALTAEEPDPAGLAAVEAAMVLLIDHDLAASTFAARVAASARAHPYAVVAAGLGAMDGPLHGAASGLAHRMLLEALESGAAVVVADHLRAGRRVPGLGHAVYQAVDPRAEELFARLQAIPRAEAALSVAREVAATTARHRALPANVDLALAVLTVSYGMPVQAGELLFAVARIAGWLAHAIEEYAERPLRMRPSGSYRGPRPPQPPPYAT